MSLPNAKRKYHTAEAYRLTLLKKLYAKNTAELAGIALRLGLAE